MATFREIVEPWLHENDSDKELLVFDLIRWLDQQLFFQYEPHSYEAFQDKIAAWLENVPDDTDRRSLFKLLEHLFFIGKQQFDSLCRAAFNDDVVRWLIERDGLDLASSDLQNQIKSAVNATWFCPMTDSMKINSFLKLNGLPGHELRPDWQSLAEFGDPSKIRTWVSRENIQRLVMLEDFVGSGKQVLELPERASLMLPGLPILVIPLVCCPGGIEKGRELARKNNLITFAPTLTLRSELFLHETAQAGEPQVFSEIRVLIGRLSPRLGDYKNRPYGFRKTGALVAMYSNCPDNTLPIIHHRTADWCPLFIRVRRS